MYYIKTNTTGSDFGITASTAFNIFARAVVRERKIPFEINSPQPEITRENGLQAFWALREEARKNGIQDMSLDEINKEIHLARLFSILYKTNQRLVLYSE